MLATENFALFQLAQELGQTVRGLANGQPGPLTNIEHYMWNRWKLARMRLEQQARRGQR